MENAQEQAAKRLLEQGFLPPEDYAKVAAYRDLKIFSLHHELQALLYFGVLLFTSGAGLIIYQNIDTIGHSLVLSLLLALCLGLYLFCFKKASKWTPFETDFDHPAYNFLVLAALLLGISFLGYWQFQYAAFGQWVEIPTLLSALLALATAYYFDNRNALSIGITALAATVGLTATPKAMLSMGFFDHPGLHYYAIGLGTLLLFWAIYTRKNQLKSHFELVFVTFGQQLFALGCVAGLFEQFWPVKLLLLAGLCSYTYRESLLQKWTVVFAFTLLYGFIGMNVLIGKTLSWINLDDFAIFLMFLTPPYLVGSIVLFVRSIRQFKRRS